MPRLKNSDFVLIFLVFFPAIVFCQSGKSLSDNELILNASFEKEEYHNHTAPFLFVHSHNILLRYNPLSLGLGSAMFVYQNVISRQFSAGCLYSPSCSEYSKRLISDFGLVKGVFLSADRISRCNRISATDIRPADVDPRLRKVRETTSIYKVH
jgi:putative component of membrane protein insertase Oxa1/YidC/SpoIIIJ protein YidD